jgi:hypothetical protein
MSAPDKSNSKAPPSLLSNAGNGTDANGSRILANLEGRVEPQADAPRSSRMPLILVALLVLCVGSWGAWRVQHHAASKPAAAVAGGNVVVKAPVAAAASAAAPATLAAASQVAPASAPQAATIISDNSADKDAASTPGTADDSRLSRALANGADDANPASSAKTVATAETKNDEHKAAKKSAEGASSESASASGKSHHDSVQTRGKHELADSKAHPANTKALAQSKKPEPGAHRREDADADLLAALVARTEPFDPKSPVSAKTSKVSASTRPANAHLAEQVAACGKNGFFEEQLCRWRVCDGHWGKDPSCPQSDSRRP